MRLHGYARSPATRRVRIALALKRRAVELVLHQPPRDGKRLAALLRLNPQGLAPVLEADDGSLMIQSFAILEWMEEMWPSPPLLPADPAGRARVRAFSMALVGDIHPIQTPRTLARLRMLGLTDAQLHGWMRQSLTEGLEACEALLSAADGPFCFGAVPGMADACLVPQLALVREFGLGLTFPRLLAAEAACLTMPAFHLPPDPDPPSSGPEPLHDVP